MDKENKENNQSSSTTTSGYQIPWIEKYRPQKLVDIVGNEETLIRLQAIANDGNLPNLILCGPPGTGKVRDYLLLRTRRTRLTDS
jgi:replication factor C subunit 2/4